MTARLGFMLAAALCIGSGCSSGGIGTHGFTSDSRYFVWQDLDQRPAPTAWDVKCIDRKSGTTRSLGKGDFVLDRSGRYVLLLPPAGWCEGEVSLVRPNDGDTTKVATYRPDPDFYCPDWLDVSVDALDPPQVSVLLVSLVDRKFRRCRLADHNWIVVEEGPADAAMMKRLDAIRHENAFSPEEVKGKPKTTPSPDGKCVLVQSGTRLARRTELRIGERVVVLSVQTDQLQEVLGDVIEFLIFRGK